MINKNTSFFIIIIISLFWFLVFYLNNSDSNQKSNQFVFSGHTMGTTYEIKIDNISFDKQKILEKGVDSVLNHINQSMSTYIPDSEISFINKFDGPSIIVSNSFNDVLSASIYYNKITKGAFDVTVKPLLEIWGFRGNPIIERPDKIKIKNVMQYVGSDKFSYNSDDKLLIKNNSKVQFDFGAIAKGYAVDQISLYLQNLGHNKHYVEIGGEIVCKGKKWYIGIAHPELDSNQGYKTIVLFNHAVATSGTYNQSFEIDDFEYSHIFDSRIGEPSKNSVISVTVISDKCINSDALATSLKVLDKDKGLTLIDSIEGVECMFIVKEEQELKNYYSKNFSDFFAN
tara:strand:+ start:65 stop:1090 length:1026 start_codon:yes stop_codon:yes gene_type:complete